MAYDKPYLSVSDQRKLLDSRGMDIPDTLKCEEYLQRIGYYRLSAYWHPFRQLSQDENGSYYLDDQFKLNTTFQQVTNLYAFDKGLRLIVLDALERIEISVRTEIALTLGKIDPLAHRNSTNFNQRFSQNYTQWIERLDEKEKSSKEEFAVHFRTNYVGDKMPIWIAVELLDFGALSILLANLLRAQQREISNSYGGISFRLIRSWIRTLSVARNICAHHSRLWNKPFAVQPAIPRENETLPMLMHLNTSPDTNKRIYALLCVMRTLLMQINVRTLWADRLKTHISTFPNNAPNISLQDAGFPDDWDELPLWKSPIHPTSVSA